MVFDAGYRGSPHPKPSTHLDCNANRCPSWEDSVGEPYLPVPNVPTLAWSQWPGPHGGTWYRSSFPKLVVPRGGQVSFNMTGEPSHPGALLFLRVTWALGVVGLAGFGTGNLFLNGIHVTFFNLQVRLL